MNFLSSKSINIVTQNYESTYLQPKNNNIKISPNNQTMPIVQPTLSSKNPLNQVGKERIIFLTKNPTMQEVFDQMTKQVTQLRNQNK